MTLLELILMGLFIVLVWWLVITALALILSLLFG